MELTDAQLDVVAGGGFWGGISIEDIMGIVSNDKGKKIDGCIPYPSFPPSRLPPFRL
jgi:hypothetical protein